MRSDSEFLDGHTIRKHLKAALERLALPKPTWYEATRHTFASYWVLAGNSLEKLREVMGYSTVRASIPTIRRWVRAGAVPIVKVGKTARVDLSRLHGSDDLTIARAARARGPSRG